MNTSSSQLLFVVSLLALYLYMNTGRRLLVSTAPLFLASGQLSQDGYGFLSSLTTLLFGVSRFLSYPLLEYFSPDKYVMFFVIISSSVCVAMTLLDPEKLHISSSVFLTLGFSLLFISLGFPFPCSSLIVRNYLAPSCSFYCKS